MWYSNSYTQGIVQAGLVFLMIKYVEGNLLEAPAEALVNTVNEVGVMGKGIALMFSEAFPENTAAYIRSLRSEASPCRAHVCDRKQRTRPAALDHQFPDQEALARRFSNRMDPRRFARPRARHTGETYPLDCSASARLRQRRIGLGRGTPGDRICSENLKDVEILVYTPTRTYQNVSKKEGLEKLTPARALIAELCRRYAVLGLECTNLEIQKLAWFLQQSILAMHLQDPLDLRFAPNRYGPYAERLRHLLDALDGSYLHSEKRLSDAGPFDLIWFNDARRSRVEEYLHSDKARTYLPALEATARLIEGYESPLGMELLATVDWLVHQEGYSADLHSIRKGIAHWPGGRDAVERKQHLFDDRLLELALNRVKMAPFIREAAPLAV